MQEAHMAERLRRMMVLAAGLTLAATLPPARAQQIVDHKETWIVSNRDISKFEQLYGDVQNMSLEALCDWTGPSIHGAVRTRGILMASPRPRPNSPGKGEPNDSPSGPGATAPRGPQGPAPGTTAPEERRYTLTLPTDRPLTTGVNGCGFGIRPGLIVADAFEFEVDSLNFQEIEVVGTFEAPVGSDRSGPSMTSSGFWFWAYARGPEKPSRAGRVGLLALEDLIARPDRLAGETVKVVGQFRGKNLFGDLEGAGEPDGWVIKDGAFAVWVVGKRPKGSGWSLDPRSRSDSARWVQVTGTLDRKGSVTRLKATEVALVPPPPPAAAPER
jgi:hypothetical protein